VRKRFQPFLDAVRSDRPDRLARNVVFYLSLGRCLATACILGAIAVFIAYAMDVERIWRPIAGGPATSPLTALLFLLSGAGIVLVRPFKVPSLTVAFTALAGGIALIRLFEIIHGAALTDRILPFADVLSREAGQGAPVATGWNTATVFALISLSLLARSEQRPRCGQVFAVLAFCLPLISLFGYAYGVREFHGEMSMTTTWLAAFLCVGALSVSARTGLVRAIVSGSDVGRFSRREVLIILAGVFLGGFVLQHLSLADQTRSLPLYAVFICLLTVITIGSAGITLETNDRKRRIAERALHKLATIDPLTGLPNRRALQLHLETLLDQPAAQKRQIVMLHIDLDYFKQINDTLGHAAGDDLLRHVSAAMRSEIRRDDLIALIGGDEFVVVVNETVSDEDTAALANRIILAASKPLKWSGETVNSGASIGIASAVDAGYASERLLMNADIALYMAKRAGRSQYCFYCEQKREEFEQNSILLRELRAGLEKNEIEAFFQPQINGASGEIIGFEALARWHHPRCGLLPPGQFLRLAFTYGLGDRLSDVITRDAIAALSEWRRLGLHVPTVSVNLSASQLRDNALVERLEKSLADAGLTAGDIAIEVVENVLFEDDGDPSLSNIQALHRRGFRVELDDFGTGHASISNLRKFKVDRIKIDRSFVFRVEDDFEQEMILRAIIGLCKNLGIECIAEGVETDAERSKLLALGCAQFQGYGVGRPMSRRDATDWLKATQSAAPTELLSASAP